MFASFFSLGQFRTEHAKYRNDGKNEENINSRLERGGHRGLDGMTGCATLFFYEGKWKILSKFKLFLKMSVLAPLVFAPLSSLGSEA